MADDKWDPTKPLPDEDDEKEVDREARARARLDYLRGTYSKPAGGDDKKKKRKSLFSDSD